MYLCTFKILKDLFYMSKYDHNKSRKNQTHDEKLRFCNRKRFFKSNKYSRNKNWNNDIKENDLYDYIHIGYYDETSKNNERETGKDLIFQEHIIKKKLWRGPIDWYRITLPFGNKYDKKFLEETLAEKVNSISFWPIAWETNGDIVTFYIDDYELAQKLQSLSGEFEMPDGFKISIKVHYGTPNVDITQEMKEKIKVAMANRYRPVNKALDLSKFHADPILKDYFCGLCKPIVLLAVIHLIEENIPELEALSLNNNKIKMLNFWKKYSYKLKNVKILHLADNKIADVTTLDSLKEMPLVELLLENNPLSDKFDDKSLYVSEMRGRFPKLMKLDGVDLPPPISFDLEEHSLPIPIQTFLCNAEGGSIVRQFLQQYFSLFDSNNRQLLTQAYHENAIFSITIAYPYGTEDKGINWLDWYSTDNRNLLKINNPDRRFKLLKKGNVSIVSFLKDMPKSRHDIMNFTVDLTVYSPIMMNIVVSGMFKELETSHKRPLIRSFLRTLVIVPSGSGYCICNEELHISNATEEQAKVFMSVSMLTPTEAGTSVSLISTESDSSEASSSRDVDNETKNQMVAALSMHSGMNLQWSMKCLQETDWNFDRATMVFTEIRMRGGIPEEAFIK